jgi:hypothetical protein
LELDYIGFYFIEIWKWEYIEIMKEIKNEELGLL